MTDATISIGIDSKPADRGAAKVSRSLNDVKKRAKQTTKEMDGLKGGLDRVAKGIRLVDGPLGGVASRFQTLNAIFRDNIGSAIALTIAFAGLGFALRKSIKLTIEQERVEAQLAATIKSTGQAAGLTAEEVKKMASAFQSVTTFGDEAIISGQNILLTFTKIGKDVFPLATEAMLNMSTALNIDLKSSAVQLGKALNDPIKGITALSRSGVQFTQEQQDLVKLLALTGKTAQAQAVILKELDVQFKDSARAARDTFGGALEALGNSLGDAFEKVKDAKALTPLINSLNDNLNIFFDTLKIAGVGALVAFTISLIPATAATVGFTASLVGLLVAVGGFGVKILTLLGPIGLLTAGVIGVTVAFGGLDKVFVNLEAIFITVGAEIDKLTNRIAVFALTIAEAFVAPFKKVKSLFIAFTKDLSEFLTNPTKSGGFDKLGKELGKQFSLGFENASKEVKAFDTLIDKLADEKIANLGGVIKDGMVDPIAAAREEMERHLALIEEYKNKIGNVKEEYDRILAEQKRLASGASELKTIFEDIAKNIKTAFTDTFKRIFSEGKVGFKTFGKDLLNIFTDTLAKMATMAIAKPILIPLLTGIGGSLGVGGGAIGDVTNPLGGKPTTGISGVSDLFSAGSAFNFNSGAADLGNRLFSGLGTSGVGPPTASAFGDFAGQAFSGGSLLGGAIGNFGANAIFGGDRGIGADIGGTLGGLAGNLIPIPVLGPLIGAAVGNFIGGLFGGGKGTVASEFETSGAAGDLSSTFGSKGTSTQFAKGVSGSVEQLIGGLGAFGLAGGDLKVRGGSNTKQRGGGFFDIYGGDGGISETIGFDENSPEALDEALGKLTLSLAKASDTTNESLLIALENITAEGRTLTEVLSDLEFAFNFDTLFEETRPVFTALEIQMQNLNTVFEEAVKTAERLGLSEERLSDARVKAEQVVTNNFNESIKDQILAIQAPSQLALREIERQAAINRRNALAAGGDLVAVEQLFGLKRQEIIERFNQEQIDTIESGFAGQLTAITNSFEDTINDLNQFRGGLALSSTLSGTNRQGRALEADRQLDELAKRIASGDASALDDLQGVSNRSLDAALSYYGPTEAFLERLAKVDTIIESAKAIAQEQFDAELSILEEAKLANISNDSSLVELQKQTRILLDLAGQTSESFLASQNIGSSQILRAGESLSDISGLNPVNQISEELVRQFKVQASGGAFDFSTATGTFGDFVTTQLGGVAAGEEFIRLLDSVGGATSEQKDIFGFANGTGNSRFSGMAIVGEEGPELVNFNRPAQIFSNGQSGSIGSGGDAINSAVSGLRQQSAKETAFLGNKFDQMITTVEELKDEMLSRRPV